MMQHFPVLAIFSLFLGAFLVTLLNRRIVLRAIVAGLSVLTSFALLCALIKPVMLDGQIISYWLGGWKPVAGYAIGIGLEVDALNLFFALVVSVAIVVSILYSYKYLEFDDARGKYYALYLMLSGGVLGLLLTGDLFNMYVMVEILTLAAVALTAYRNFVSGALEAAFKYLVVSTIGSTGILVGTGMLYLQFHTLNLAQLSALINSSYLPSTILAMALLIAGYSCKAFLFPFHPLAADAHGVAPSSISVIISGVLTKVGVYGIIRICYCLFRSMDKSAMQVFLVLLGTISMFVCVTMALAQKDFKRLLAFHSISQVGYVVTACGLAGVFGLTAGLYHAMNHTLFKGLLFLCAGCVLHQTGTTKLDELGGLYKKMPKTFALFLIGAASISGIPPFNGFASKWLIYQAIYQKAAETNNLFYMLVVIVAIVTSVLTLASFVKVAHSVFFGQLPEKLKNIKEASPALRAPMWILALLCILTGVFPGLVIRYLTGPAAVAALNATHYIDAMLGEGYAAAHAATPIVMPSLRIGIPGVYSPGAWLLLLLIVLLGFAVFALLLKGGRGARSVGKTSDDPKYDLFFGGEKSEYSQVGGSDLFWGFKYKMRGYFSYMHEAHSGIVNDYALWGVAAVAITVLYMFLFM